MGCLDDDAVLAFVAGEVDASSRASTAAHLDECADCRRLVAHAAAALLPTGETVTTGGALHAGDRVGRYQVEGRLGGGAMGVVYAARHLDLQRPVALKIARADDRDGPQLRARLLREARAASAIRHHRVVTVHDVLTLDDGSPVIVMDRLSGETLRARLARGGLEIGDVIALADQLLEALEAAHAIGVVHRDLKPDNIFLEEDGIRVVDFGIAKLTAIDGPTAETAGLTATGMLVGTPHYMAPEQAFADPDVDARADLWAVGAILYECLSGQRPIVGDRTGQVLRNLARLDIVPLAERAPGVSPGLAELVHALLQERHRRPESAREVRARLRALAPDALASDRRSVVPAVDGDAATLAVRSDSLEGHAASQAAPSRRRAWWLVTFPLAAAVGWLAISGEPGAPSTAAPAPGTAAATTGSRPSSATDAPTSAAPPATAVPTAAPAASNVPTRTTVVPDRPAPAPKRAPTPPQPAAPKTPELPKPPRLIDEPPF